MGTELKLDVWRKIFTLISKDPGLDINEIAEKLDIGTTIVKRYVSSMAENKEITPLSEGDHIRYYLGKSALVSHQDRRTEGTRMQLYILISKNPGLHLSKIAEMLDMSPPLAKYHLSYMEKKTLVMAVEDDNGYYKRYYIKDSDVGVKNKRILSLLRQKHLLKIVLLLLKNGNLQHKDILDKIDVGASTLSYHLNKLVEHEIITVGSYGGQKGYSIKNDKEIIGLIRQYKLDSIKENFKDTWKDLNLFT